MKTPYPVSVDDIGPWARTNRRPLEEARARFAQYGVLCAISRSRSLRGCLVFKGGNALDFLWQPNRSTRDLDFSIVDGGTITHEQIEGPLRRALQSVERELGILYNLNKVEQRPPGEKKTFRSYEVTIGFAFPTDSTSTRKRLREGYSPRVIPLDISTNDPVCDMTEMQLNLSDRIQVCTLEDIAAEKLRALLQQPIRNRNRRQDVLDLALILPREDLDLGSVASYLSKKSQARGITPTRTAFRSAEIMKRALFEYHELAATTREQFLPFDEAWQIVLQVVDQLDMPP